MVLYGQQKLKKEQFASFRVGCALGMIVNLVVVCLYLCLGEVEVFLSCLVV
jgi:hypothetical protein